MSKAIVNPRQTLCRPDSAGKDCLRSTWAASMILSLRHPVGFSRSTLSLSRSFSSGIHILSLWPFRLGWCFSTSMTSCFFSVAFHCFRLLFNIISFALIFLLSALGLCLLFLLTWSGVLCLSLPLLLQRGVLHASGSGGGKGSLDW